LIATGRALISDPHWPNKAFVERLIRSGVVSAAIKMYGTTCTEEWLPAFTTLRWVAKANISVSKKKECGWSAEGREAWRRLLLLRQEAIVLSSSKRRERSAGNVFWLRRHPARKNFCRKRFCRRNWEEKVWSIQAGVNSRE
jgi:hypothetical protein